MNEIRITPILILYLYRNASNLKRDFIRNEISIFKRIASIQPVWGIVTNLKPKTFVLITSEFSAEFFRMERLLKIRIYHRGWGVFFIVVYVFKYYSILLTWLLTILGSMSGCVSSNSSVSLLWDWHARCSAVWPPAVTYHMSIWASCQDKVSTPRYSRDTEESFKPIILPIHHVPKTMVKPMICKRRGTFDILWLDFFI